MRKLLLVLFVFLLGSSGILLIAFTQPELKDKPSTPSEKILGTWLGTYFNKYYYVSNHTLFHFEEDGKVDVRFLNGLGEDTTWHWKVEEGQLYMDTLVYDIDLLTKDELGMTTASAPSEQRKYYYRAAKRPKEVRTLPEIAAIETILDGKTWMDRKQAKGGFYHLDYWQVEGKQFHLTRYYYHDDTFLFAESETYCYEIQDHNGYLFFVTTSYQGDSCNVKNMDVRQITNVGKQSFTLYKNDNPFTFFDNTVREKAFTTYQISELPTIPVDLVPTSDFNLCNQELLSEYYRFDLDYKGGQKEMNRFILARYQKPQNTADQNGYFQVRFTVNCEGAMGHFTVKECDLKYQPYTFDSRISEQLLDLVRMLPDWIPGVHPHTKANVDTYRHIAFRIEKGEVVEVVP